MGPLDLLTSEHTLLKSLTDALSASLDGLTGGQAVPSEVLHDLVLALAFHLEQVHMAKEEHVLFPYLEAHGLPRTTAVVNALATQHQIVRFHLADLRTRCAGFHAGDNAARDGLILVGREFIALFREHARIEEEYFYGLAAQNVPPDDWEPLLARFDAIDLVTNARGRRRVTEEILARHRAVLGPS